MTRKEYRAKWYQENKPRVNAQQAEYKSSNPPNPEKIMARNRLNSAVKHGHIIRPTQCPTCGSGVSIEAHHHSYEKRYWLDVVWVCKECHIKLHKNEKQLDKEG